MTRVCELFSLRWQRESKDPCQWWDAYSYSHSPSTRQVSVAAATPVIKGTQYWERTWNKTPGRWEHSRTYGGESVHNAGSQTSQMDRSEIMVPTAPLRNEMFML